MKFLNFFKVSFSILAVVSLFSCSSDDDSPLVIPVVDPEPTLVVPDAYTFTNEAGESTVSFSGQTQRLQMGEEILDLFEAYGTTEATLDEMFGGVDGVSSGFSAEDLNGTTKIIRSKTAASDEYFSTNTAEQAEIRSDFDGYITSQVNTFLSVYADVTEVPTATAGTAGILGSRIVNEKGLEYKQAFNKGLIGAFTLDQVVNNYLTRCLNEDYQTSNTNDELVDGKVYTTLEHYWDEAYGYVYGNLDDDSFMYKYIGRVEGDSDFAGIASDIETAFRTGRAAIVADDYTTLEEQVETLQQLLSEVIAIRVVYYLQQGKANVSDITTINSGDAFHDLSEGYGFVYSLRFTRNPATGDTFFSKETVDGYLASLEAGNGFWDLADDTSVLDTISEAVAAEFDFTVAEAAE